MAALGGGSVSYERGTAVKPWDPLAEDDASRGGFGSEDYGRAHDKAALYKAIRHYLKYPCDPLQ